MSVIASLGFVMALAAAQPAQEPAAPGLRRAIRGSDAASESPH